MENKNNLIKIIKQIEVTYMYVNTDLSIYYLFTLLLTIINIYSKTGQILLLQLDHRRLFKNYWIRISELKSERDANTIFLWRKFLCLISHRKLFSFVTNRPIGPLHFFKYLRWISYVYFYCIKKIMKFFKQKR